MNPTQIAAFFENVGPSGQSLERVKNILVIITNGDNVVFVSKNSLEEFTRNINGMYSIHRSLVPTDLNSQKNSSSFDDAKLRLGGGPLRRANRRASAKVGH